MTSEPGLGGNFLMECCSAENADLSKQKSSAGMSHFDKIPKASRHASSRNLLARQVLKSAWFPVHLPT